MPSNAHNRHTSPTPSWPSADRAAAPRHHHSGPSRPNMPAAKFPSVAAPSKLVGTRLGCWHRTPGHTMLEMARRWPRPGRDPQGGLAIPHPHVFRTRARIGTRSGKSAANNCSAPAPPRQHPDRSPSAGPQITAPIGHGQHPPATMPSDGSAKTYAHRRIFQQRKMEMHP